jgi:hypothetical protein
MGLPTEFNFIIENEHLFGDEAERIFGGEPVTMLPPGSTFQHILVRLGIFSSVSQARKDPKWGSVSLTGGFEDFRNLGKLKLRASVFQSLPVDRELLTRLDAEDLGR